MLAWANVLATRDLRAGCSRCPKADLRGAGSGSKRAAKGAIHFSQLTAGHMRHAELVIGGFLAGGRRGKFARRKRWEGGGFQVGFSHNSPRWWWNRFAKAERGKRKAGEETREMGARGLSIVRRSMSQKEVGLCEKTVKTPFWRQKTIWRNSEVVGAQGVSDLPARIMRKCESRVRKKSGRDRGMGIEDREKWKAAIPTPRSPIPTPRSSRRLQTYPAGW